MASTTRTLHIVYNADSTIMGKLRYGYSKWQSKPSDSEPTCAACDITHGGLSLSETKAWKQAKEEITAQDPHLRVVQWHRDEMNPQVRIRAEPGISCTALPLPKACFHLYMSVTDARAAQGFCEEQRHPVPIRTVGGGKQRL